MVKGVLGSIATFLGMFLILAFLFTIASGGVDSLDDKWIWIALVMAIPPTVWVEIDVVEIDDSEEDK